MGAPKRDTKALWVSFTVGDDHHHLQKVLILRNGHQNEAEAWDTPRRLGESNCQDYLVIEIMFTEGLVWAGHCSGVMQTQRVYLPARIQAKDTNRRLQQRK